ncbi:hypothetical protein E4K72_13355 [Oxalobacteraceae bacterium OM1]|nr:hypothetical protein E4K72_13355 [Oxalobacteraceae bacterium OM1]
MLNFHSPRFLRNVLLVDAATCVASGLLMSLGAAPLAALLELPEVPLREAGLILLPFAAFVAFTATRERIPRGLVWCVIAANAMWTLDSIALLLSGWVSPNGLGTAFVLMQAIAVAALAELEFFGLKRASPVAA